MTFFNCDRITRVIFWGCVSGIISEITHFLGLMSCWVAFFTIWFITAGTFLALASLHHTADGKAVLISGCDTGFGHAVALHLHKMGFRVFAGCLQADTEGEGAQKLRALKSDRLHVVQLDVTKQEQIDSAINTISDNMKKGEVLWGVINNAGIALYGAVEWVSMDTVRRLCDINLFGTIALTKACLPLIRRAKGRVVTTSSARGRMASPLGTTYETSKFGIEGFSDGLRLEMKEFGVDVCIVEPGNYVLGTGVYTKKIVEDCANKMWNEMTDEVREGYGGRAKYDKLLEFQKAICNSGFKDVTPVVEAMSDALTQRFPQSRYQPMGIYLYCITFISQHFPEWIYDYISLEILMKAGWDPI